MEWYHVCWPRLTAKRVEPVVSISWASCFVTLRGRRAVCSTLSRFCVAVYGSILMPFSTFCSEWIALSDGLEFLIYLARWRHNFREIAVKNCESSKIGRKVCNALTSAVQTKYSIQLGWDELFQSTYIMQLNEFEYHFACRRKVVHLCFIMSPGKMIFAVLELWLSPLQWVLNSSSSSSLFTQNQHMHKISF